MRDGGHPDHVVQFQVVNDLRETPCREVAGTRSQVNRATAGILLNAFQHANCFVVELLTEPGALFLVPRLCRDKLGLGLPVDNEPT